MRRVSREDVKKRRKPVRVTQVKAEPHRKRGGRPGQAAGPPSDGIPRIATEMLDVPSEVIENMYKYR
jgi:hypothetical protein